MGFFTNSMVTNISIHENVQYVNNSMYNAFRSCSNFNSDVVIPNGVTNLSHSFMSCANFNRPINIPDTVVNLVNTFYSCKLFNQPLNIPNNLDNGVYALRDCQMFNNPLDLGGITNLNANVKYFLYNCRNFNQPVILPNVTDLGSFFYDCANFNQSVRIPSTVTNLLQTFRGCNNLSGNIIIEADHVIAVNQLFAYKYNNRRVNIFVHKGSLTELALKQQGQTNSIIAWQPIGWANITNCSYNAVYNIYIYNNL